MKTHCVKSLFLNSRVLVQYNVILYTELQRLEQNLIRDWTYKTLPSQARWGDICEDENWPCYDGTALYDSVFKLLLSQSKLHEKEEIANIISDTIGRAITLQ